MFPWFSDQLFQCVPLLILFVTECCGHVVLTYPPARMYPLDFLNSMDTPAPCGMPRDPSLLYYTDLPVGSSLQVFWDIAYPHRGGLFMELLNSNNEVLQRHPPEGEALADDVSQLNQTIQLPQEPCVNCTLRIVKRGLEFGDNLLIWSCADVNLVTSPMTDRQRCSNHGSLDGTRCVCDRMYDGEICQFQNDCVDESDCNNHGQCVDIEAVKYPRQVCFCSPGWFGRFCGRESPVKSSSSINLLEYTQRNLTNNFTLYHRVLQDSQELEVVLVARSITWIAVGWRSKDANKTCKGFPVLNFGNDGNGSSHEATTPGRALPTEPPAPTPDQCNGSCNVQSGCLYDVGWTQDPNAQTVTFTVRVRLLSDEYFGLGFSRDNEMADSDIVVGWVRSNGTTYLSDRWATARARPEEDSHNDLSLISSQSVDDLTVLSFLRALDTKDPNDQALGDAECIYLLTAKGKKTDDGTFEYHTQKRSSSERFCFNKCQGSVVAGQVTEPTRGDSSATNRVPDSTTRNPDTTNLVPDTTNLVPDTTNLVPDTTNLVPDTTNLIPDTTNFVPDTTNLVPDTTNLVPDTTNFVPDTTNLVPDTTNLVPETTTWAPDTTNLVPATTIRVPDTTNRVPDGEGSSGGGTVPMPTSCDGSCSLPSGCLYNVSWTYDPATDRVNFSVAVQLESTEYFGLGFSEDQLMPESDIVVGWVRSDGKTFLSDRWASARAQPAEDTHNDLTLISGQVVNRVTSVTFSRAVVTSDSQDLPLNVPGCIYLLTAKGTKTNDDTFLYHSHKRSSSEKFCFNKCQGSTVAGQVTEPTRSDSFTTNSVPDTTNRVPVTITTVRDTPTNVPDTANVVPDSTTNVPNTTNVVPDSTTNVPDRTKVVPDTTTNVPNTTNVVPDSTTNVPNTTNVVPDSTTNVPDTTNVVPDSTTNVPATTTRVSDTTNRVPGGDRSTGGRSEPTPNSCDGACSVPSDCLYNVSWTYDPATDAVSFFVAVQLESTEYFGLGFSKDQLMPNSDIIVGWVRDDGLTYLSDRWAADRITPEEDAHNDLTAISSRVVNGITMVTFSRSLDTKDLKDQALNVPDCIYLLTSVGFKVDEDNSFSRHARKQSSTRKYCFSNCHSSTATEGDRRSRRRKRASDGETTGKSETNSKDKLEPMDCTDVVVGTARGNLSRIADHYTRDRSTPLRDEVYGGSDSLTAAIGFERDGFTTILFRKKLQSTEMTDWSVADELMHVIWARGQQAGEIHHRPDSAYERNEMSERDFYKPDVLKYHGSNNRGMTTFNFFDPPTSRATPAPDETASEEPSSSDTTPALESTPGSVQPPVSEATPTSGQSPSQGPATSKASPTSESTPTPDPGATSASSSCSSGGCTDIGLCLYNITWTYNATDDSVMFTINATVSERQWIALGIMSEIEMSLVDVIVMYFAADQSGAFTTPVVLDRHSTGSIPGDPDTKNDVHLLTGQREHGVSSFTFKRQSITDDNDDVDLHSNGINCPFLVYEIGGTVDSNGGLSSAQNETISGQERVCFGVCADPIDTTVSGEDIQATLTTNMAAKTGVPDSQSTTSATVTSIQPASTPSGSTTNEESSVIVVIPSAIKLVNMNYSQELSDLSSQAAQQMKVPIEIELNRKLTENVVHLKMVVVTRFSPGSVVVDFDVRVESKDSDSEEVRQQVETSMGTVLKDGTLSGHTLDKDYLVIGESRTEKITGNENDKGGLGDVEIIVIVVVIVVCLVVGSLIGYKIWTRKKVKSSMNQTRNGNGYGNSYVGSNGDQSSAELQESSRNSKEDGRWSNTQEARQPRSYDNDAYDTSQKQYQTYSA